MTLAQFQKFMAHMVEAGKVIQESVPLERLEHIQFQVNITQAAQWIRNYRESLQPKDFIMNRDELRSKPREDESGV